ncbi:MAG: mechanosensitive ion channel family protein [Candidatus Eremiobacteraeota bacterium]|nr:mechanosensitive ion channel family protein [Candidatus Eremiobacteraeota bacterium]
MLRIIGGKLSRKLDSIKKTKIKSLNIQKIQILSKEGIVSFFVYAYYAFSIIFILSLFSFYFNHFLTYFPGTEAIRSLFYKYPLAYIKQFGISIITYIPRLIFIIISIIFFRFLLSITDRIFESLEKGTIMLSGFHKEYLGVTKKIVKFLIYFFTLVLIAPNLPGYNSPVFKGLSIVTVIAVSLGSSSFFTNILAGLSIIYSRFFKVGDYIKIGNEAGEVIEITLMTTKLRTPTKQDVSIPNSIVLKNSVINYSSPIPEEKGTILHTTITIGYDIPGDKIEELCLSAIEDTDNLLKEPKPFVLEKSLDDFYVTYQICAYTDNPQLMRTTYSDLHSNIRKQFNKAGVEIMSPHYSALRDGTGVTIPKQQA